jgi:hypothetical protein
MKPIDRYGPAAPGDPGGARADEHAHTLREKADRMEDAIDDRAILAETYNHTARALFDKAEAIKEGIHASDMFSSGKASTRATCSHRPP